LIAQNRLRHVFRLTNSVNQKNDASPHTKVCGLKALIFRMLEILQESRDKEI